MIPWWEEVNGIQVPGLDIQIQLFGLLVAIGVFCGTITTIWRAKKFNINLDMLLEFILYVLGTSFLGSHIFHVIFYSPEEFFNNPLTLLNPFGTQSSIGGFLSAFLGAYIWKLRRKVDFKALGDQMAFGMPVGWFFGRMGCFVVHDHPGKLTNFFLGVQNYQYAGLSIGTRHDLGLYEMLWSFFTFIMFLILDRKPRPAGFFTMMFFTFFAICRFWLDFLREIDGLYYGLTIAQWVCIGATIVGVLYVRKLNRSGEFVIPEELKKV
jgi:phosphatidylglycerol:prolipoprotein diacylglycerol transferase